MPSLSHEALLMLFRNRPELAPELLRNALHVELPEYTEVRIESAELTQVAPAEYHADLVVLLVDGKPVLGIVVEVQLAEKKRKRFTWPLYVAGLRARLECETCVLVVTPSSAVAIWAAAPIRLGPGSTVQPLVLGPDAVPVVVDEAVARADPELAVLSAMAHASAEPATAAQIAFAALRASLGLQDERGLLYSDLIRIALGEAARAALEELMEARNYEFQSEFAKRHDALGRAKGKVDAILRVLAKRGIAVSDAQRQRITECTDFDTLDRWLDSAVTAASTDELFA